MSDAPLCSSEICLPKVDGSSYSFKEGFPHAVPGIAASFLAEGFLGVTAYPA